MRPGHPAAVVADARTRRKSRIGLPEGRRNSWLRLRSSGITLAGFPINDTRLALDGLTGDHALRFRVGSGQDTLSLHGGGAWAEGRYTLRLEGIEASGPRLVPWQLESPGALAVNLGEASLDPVCLVYEERRFCLQGRWRSGGEWTVNAETESFPLEALDPKRLGAPRYRGFLAVDAEVSGRAGAPWIADVNAEIRDASLTYQSASGAERHVELGLTRLTIATTPEIHRFVLRVSDRSSRTRRRAGGGTHSRQRPRRPPACRQRQGPDSAAEPAAAARGRDRQRLG